MVSTANTVDQGSLDQAPQTLTPEWLARENRQHDRILTWLLLGAAFLLASFPIADPEIWLHLRTGQMIVAGEFPWHSDPYAYTMADKPWVHAGWLSDVIFWLTYNSFGGPGLVLLRGLIFLAIAALLLRLQRPQGNGLAAVFALGLALVAMGPRLYLRPELFSYLMLALTLVILAQPPLPAATGWFAKLTQPMQGRLYLLLVPLCALWANLDAWFLLGPVTVALWLAGAWLQGKLSSGPHSPSWPDRAEQRALALAGIAALLACLLNPWHIAIFQLPPELSSPFLHYCQQHKGDLRLEAVLRPWQSPWQGSYFDPLTSQTQAYYYGLSPAEWCYYPLVLCGALVLLLRLFRGQWQGALLWLGMFALSAYQVKNVPFFALVAGPYLMLGLQDALGRREFPSVRRLSVLGGQTVRILMLFGLMVLIGCQIWPFPPAAPLRPGMEVVRGWVHPLGSVGWSIWSEPSLEQAMHRVKEWRAQKLLTDQDQGFYLDWYEHPSYQVFFDPAGKHALDRRFGAFDTEAAAEFTQAFIALRETSKPLDLIVWNITQEQNAGWWTALSRAKLEIQNRQQRWQTIFRKYNVNFLVLGRRRVTAVVKIGQRRDTVTTNLEEELLKEVDAFDPKDVRPVWRLLNHVDGQTYLLAWNGAARKLPSETEYNPDTAVFQHTLSATDRSRWTHGEPPVKRESFWASLLSGNLQGVPPESAAALWHLQRARNELQAHLAPPQEYLPRLQLYVADMMVDLFNTHAAQRLWVPVPAFSVYLLPYGQPPSAAEAHLAIRSARRSLANSATLTPTQRGQLYALLAQAYQQLQETELRTTSALRQTELRDHQYFFALRQAADLLPNDVPLQVELTRACAQRGLLELTLQNFERLLNEARSQPPPDVRMADGTTRPMNDKELLSWPTQLEHNLQMALSQPAFRFDVAKLREAVKQQQLRYAQDTAGLQNQPLDRAQIALQLGLASRAATDLTAAQQQGPTANDEKRLWHLSMEAAFRLGDLPSVVRLMPYFRKTFTPGDLEGRDLPFFAYAAAGDYEGAETYLQELDGVMKELAAQRLIASGELQALGGAAGLANLSLRHEITGSQFTGQMVTLEGIRMTEQRARLLICGGLLALEAGQPHLASQHFRTAIEKLSPGSALRPLAGHYYLRITKQLVDH
jgi:hypothetical protein